MRKLTNQKKEDPRRGKMSASDFPALAKCNGKKKQSAGRPNPSSPEATMGTRIHQKAHDWESIELEGRELELATQCVEERNIILSRIWPDWRDCPPAAFDEERMWYRGDRFSGVPDVMRVRGKVGLIIDYKTGPKRVTDAEGNWQLRGLATLAQYIHGIEECHVIIVQPLAGRPTTHYYDKKGLKSARRKCVDLCRKVEGKHPRLTAGEEQCRYCLAKSDCPAIEAKEAALMRSPEPSTMTPIHFSAVLAILPLVEARCKAIKAEALARLQENPLAVPGYVLRAGAERRSIKDTECAAQILIDAKLIDARGLVECSTIPLGRLEAAVSSFTGTDKYEARFAIAEALDGIIELSNPSPKVVEE